MNNTIIFNIDLNLDLEALSTKTLFVMASNNTLVKQNSVIRHHHRLHPWMLDQVACMLIVGRQKMHSLLTNFDTSMCNSIRVI